VITRCRHPQRHQRQLQRLHRRTVTVAPTCLPRTNRVLDQVVRAACCPTLPVHLPSTAGVAATMHPRRPPRRTATTMGELELCGHLRQTIHCRCPSSKTSWIVSGEI
jgi:hypothetical protein